MKTAKDPRHIKRARLIKDLFAWQYNSKSKNFRNLKPIIEHLEEIDLEIKNAAPSRPLEQINKVDLAILRLAVFELIIEKDQPFKVVVDEAVELAKEYGSESSSSLVNAVLGKIIESQEINK